MTHLPAEATETTPPFEVIRAMPDHAPVIAPLFDRYRQFYRQASDLTAAHTFVAARLGDGSSMVFLAISTGAAPGTALGFTQLYPSFSSISLRPAYILYDLWVDPPCRRRGIGSALLANARDFAISVGASEMTLQTAVTNDSAQALYESLGWRRDDEFLNYVLSL